MGHALNNTIQDILIRYQRMRGKASLWMPGTDHAGIATQNVVEKQIAKEGMKRQGMGREKFIERVWQWREQYGSVIIHQLKKLGASCDWSRLRFTMDKEYCESVLEVFVRLYEKNLIYQGDYIINWCPRCQTALSDEEAPHNQIQGSLYYLKYPFKDNPEEYISVATTRPETMLGDTAVAVNPKDKRYKLVVGRILILPLMNREIKIISDSLVDMKFGTGAVKVTPAHDPNDYALGKKHNLEFINVIYPDGRMNKNAGDYKDMDRFKAREAILRDLKERRLLDKVEPHQFSAGHCYRCHTIIEPYLSRQWFVKMKPLAKPAIEAVKTGRIKFHPQRWAKVYLNWMQNIQDWCISRQIWWGHRIPVWYCRDCNKIIEVTYNSDNKGYIMRKAKPIVSRTPPDKCPDCGGSNLVQDEDVLDTWFSSWLWPFATFKDKKDLEYFYPTSVLVTAPEIIFFWVARMIMAGFEFMGKEPFHDVYIHGTVRDIEGKKMSKSLGNIIDPLDIIGEYGADALRFSLISITAQGQDVFLSKERFEQGRNFANKIWNASRFILMNLEPGETKVDLCVFFSATRSGGSAENLGGKKEELDIVNRWILSRFYSVLRELDIYLAAYKFNEAANLLYGFFWHEFCDWYLEMAKPALSDSPQSTVHKNTQVVMYKVLEKFLRVLHPFMPFITEQVWQALPHEGPSIMTQPWPHLQERLIDKKSQSQMESAMELIAFIRNLRQELEIPLADKIGVKIFSANKPDLVFLESLSVHIRNLAKAGPLSFGSKYLKCAGSFEAVLKDIHIVIPLTGVIDAQKHKEKTQQRIKKLEAEISAKRKLLKNDNFVKKAPAEIVGAEKAKLKELGQLLKKLEVIRDGFR